MSDIMVLVERYAAFMVQAHRLQDAIDAIGRANAGGELGMLVKGLEARRLVAVSDAKTVLAEISLMAQGGSE